MFTKTGKKTVNEQIKTLLSKPGPNQMTSKGATAAMGMDWLPTKKGESIRSAIGDLESPYPSSAAALTPKIKPSRISFSVAEKCRQSIPLARTSKNFFPTSAGLGRMKLGSFNANTRICQSSKKTNKDRGSKSSRFLLIRCRSRFLTADNERAFIVSFAIQTMSIRYLARSL